MTRLERIRETLKAPPSPEYFRDKVAQGWKLVAVEWERPATETGTGIQQEVPYGLRVAADCHHLEEDPREMQALALMLELIVDDHPLSAVADAVNRQGFRTRRGSQWTQSAIFDMLPRLIEATPGIFSDESWTLRRRRLGRTQV